ncbi:hypothetical protein F4819DRAFT_508752 [Hypoxylon fuscum]|nr:hypothetical protein F4819DRAFT_508752 [Hypoxylon fuscum]
MSNSNVHSNNSSAFFQTLFTLKMLEYFQKSPENKEISVDWRKTPKLWVASFKILAKIVGLIVGALTITSYLTFVSLWLIDPTNQWHPSDSNPFLQLAVAAIPNLFEVLKPWPTYPSFSNPFLQLVVAVIANLFEALKPRPTIQELWPWLIKVAFYFAGYAIFYYVTILFPALAILKICFEIMLACLLACLLYGGLLVLFCVWIICVIVEILAKLIHNWLIQKFEEHSHVSL